MLYDTKNCIIKTPYEKLIVIDGLEDYIVAEFDNVLMICPKDNEQQVKKFVADVKNQKGDRFV
jgi:mannose-1-phosphate guanylyltransferase